MDNNKELVFLIDKNDPADSQLFDDAFKEVDYINQTSERFDLNTPKPTFTKQAESRSSKEKSTSTISTKGKGFCIRTGIEIPFNLEKPMSYEAFKSWSKYSDPDYSEKFCHFSGEQSNGETSVSRPILKKNWKKAKEIFDF